MTRARRTAPEDVDVYVAFPDGIFDYVCAECTALCCKGHGFGGSLSRGLRSLFVLYPALEAATTSRRGPHVELATPRDGCFFLDPDDRCRVEKEHGAAQKPTVCRMFPFNVMRRLGETLVVSPNFLCPLRLRLPARPGEVLGTHAEIESGVRAELSVSGSVPERAIEARGTARDRRGLVAREIAFRDACAASLGRDRFAERLARSASEPDAFVGDRVRVARLLGAESVLDAPRDGLDDVFLAIAPALRLDYLRLSPDGVLRALAIGELVVRRLSALAERPYGPHEVANLAGTYRPAILLLAHGDETVPLRRAISKVPPFGDAALAFAAFGALRGIASGRGPLAALEGAIPEAMSVSDRMALIVDVGGLVVGAMGRRISGLD